MQGQGGGGLWWPRHNMGGPVERGRGVAALQHDHSGESKHYVQELAQSVNKDGLAEWPSRGLEDALWRMQSIFATEAGLPLTACPETIGTALRAKIDARPDVSTTAQRLAFALDFEFWAAEQAGVDQRVYWGTDCLSVAHDFNDPMSPVRCTPLHARRLAAWQRIAEGTARLHLLVLVCAKAPSKADALAAAQRGSAPLPAPPAPMASTLHQYTRTSAGRYCTRRYGCIFICMQASNALVLKTAQFC